MAGDGILSLVCRTIWKYFVEFYLIVTVFAYPVGIVFCIGNHMAPTKGNAKLFYLCLLAVWIPVTVYAYYTIILAGWSTELRCVAAFFWFLLWDQPMICFCSCAFLTECVYSMEDRKENRLFNKKPTEQPQFKGPNIVILGNGPSLVSEPPCGEMIDAMDEVVRFNNFQTKNTRTENYNRFTGHKTTVHFSDSMLYPSYPEYNVPDACKCLSLFMDRLMVSGSYFLFRIFTDLCYKEACEMMFDQKLGWLSYDDIHNLKERLGISRRKHPTSGCLAIDWFVRNRPDKTKPIYIHGFDFFQGPQVHYYSKTEPLYERLNDLLGVFMMHEPLKEKAFVEQLVAEGKVAWLCPKKLGNDGIASTSPQPEAPKQSIIGHLCGAIWSCVVAINRMLTVLTYPVALPFIALSHCPATRQNATWYWRVLMSVWIPASATFYYNMWNRPWDATKFTIHFFYFWAIDVAFFWALLSILLTRVLLGRKVCTNRLFGDGEPKFHGKKIVVLGNGPSLAKGKQHAKLIDGMDEVVRFNNFQASATFKPWTGSKTTVHFSDSMLYPSYPEYAVPGTCVVLSLFMDRFMVAISYFCFRMGIDLAPWSAWKMLGSKELGWLSSEDIQNLKTKLGSSGHKHPTSGCLAIDWMVRNRPDPNEPIYIHGFDFFQGSAVHYYTKSEPLYERLNDLLGVTIMHEPQKEKTYVAELIKQGKVMLLDTLAEKEANH